MATATGLYAQHLDFVKNSGEVIHHGINFSVPLTFEVDENDELVWTFDGVRHKGVSEVIFRENLPSLLPMPWTYPINKAESIPTDGVGFSLT